MNHFHHKRKVTETSNTIIVIPIQTPIMETLNILNKHVEVEESLQGNSRYSYGHCDYKSKQKNALKIHKESKHIIVMNVVTRP